jgi:hypothetical protein
MLSIDEQLVVRPSANSIQDHLASEYDIASDLDGDNKYDCVQCKLQRVRP